MDILILDFLLFIGIIKIFQIIYLKDNKMNTWSGGKRHPMYQSEHKEWNAKHYPGTRQLCIECGSPTRRCEDDTIYLNNEIGPLCEDCYLIMTKEKTD